jgi:FemAB-related protein (PEP-CTERM system-associated)
MSEAVSVELYSPSRKPDWENFIFGSASATLAHDLRWKAVVEETYGHRPFYLMAYRERRAAGVLPLFLIKSLIFGRSLVTSPYLTFGGLLAEDDDAAAALVESAKKIAGQQKVKYTEIRNDHPTPHLEHTKLSYFTLLLDLSLGEEKLLKSLHSTARRNVKKAQQSGLEVVEGVENLEEFVKINFKNMHRLGTPAHGRAFFKNIIKHFPDSILLMARHQQTWVGGMLLVSFKKTIHMPWVAALEEYFEMRPNNLLYWEAMARAARRGFQFFDFGRSKEDQGTFRFKAQHGAQPVQLYYQYHLNGANEVPNLDPEASAFRTLVEIWKKLPLPVVNLVGPRLIGKIP